MGEIAVETTENKQHWEDLAGNYSRAWGTLAKQYMSDGELNFINSALVGSNLKVLDVGVGNGRIMESILSTGQVNELYGIDIARGMVEHCKARFGSESRVKDLRVLDVANEPLGIDSELDAITSVRVLKYNENWKEIVAKFKDGLKSGGSMAFSMPNKVSLNIFSKYHIKAYKSSVKDLQKLGNELDLEMVQLKTFTRVPDVFYTLSKNSFYQKLIVASEKVLGVVLGPSFFGRELFVHFKKK